MRGFGSEAHRAQLKDLEIARLSAPEESYGNVCAKTLPISAMAAFRASMGTLVSVT